jgi:hypothetical protein
MAMPKVTNNQTPITDAKVKAVRRCNCADIFKNRTWPLARMKNSRSINHPAIRFFQPDILIFSDTTHPVILDVRI